MFRRMCLTTLFIEDNHWTLFLVPHSFCRIGEVEDLESTTISRSTRNLTKVFIMNKDDIEHLLEDLNSWMMWSTIVHLIYICCKIYWKHLCVVEDMLDGLLIHWWRYAKGPTWSIFIFTRILTNYKVNWGF